MSVWVRRSVGAWVCVCVSLSLSRCLFLFVCVKVNLICKSTTCGVPVPVALLLESYQCARALF